MVRHPVGCACDRCGNRYSMDLMIPDAFWESIKPSWKPVGGGLLCPQCIINSLTQLLKNKYAAFEVRQV